MKSTAAWTLGIFGLVIAVIIGYALWSSSNRVSQAAVQSSAAAGAAAGAAATDAAAKQLKDVLGIN